MTLSVQQLDDSIRFEVQVTTRGSRAAVVGMHDGALEVSLTAAPVDGAANDALIKLLARALSVPRGCVQIVKGRRARRKTLLVQGTSAKALSELWVGK